MHRRTKGPLICRLLTAGQQERLFALIKADPAMTHAAVAEALGVAPGAVRAWVRHRGLGPMPRGGRLHASTRNADVAERRAAAVANIRKIMGAAYDR